MQPSCLVSAGGDPVPVFRLPADLPVTLHVRTTDPVVADTALFQLWLRRDGAWRNISAPRFEIFRAEPEQPVLFRKYGPTVMKLEIAGRSDCRRVTILVDGKAEMLDLEPFDGPGAPGRAVSIILPLEIAAPHHIEICPDCPEGVDVRAYYIQLDPELFHRRLTHLRTELNTGSLWPARTAFRSLLDGPTPYGRHPVVATASWSLAAGYISDSREDSERRSQWSLLELVRRHRFTGGRNRFTAVVSRNHDLATGLAGIEDRLNLRIAGSWIWNLTAGALVQEAGGMPYRITLATGLERSCSPLPGVTLRGDLELFYDDIDTGDWNPDSTAVDPRIATFFRQEHERGWRSRWRLTVDPAANLRGWLAAGIRSEPEGAPLATWYGHLGGAFYLPAGAFRIELAARAAGYRESFYRTRDERFLGEAELLVVRDLWCGSGDLVELRAGAVRRFEPDAYWSYEAGIRCHLGLVGRFRTFLYDEIPFATERSHGRSH